MNRLSEERALSQYRKMEINGWNWRYNVGRKHVEIRPPNDCAKKMLPLKTEVNAETVAKLTDDKLADDPSLVDRVTPSEIKAYILKHAASVVAALGQAQVAA